MKIAVIGTGVSGLTCALLLSRRHEVHVFEADSRVGGHSNTVMCESPEGALLPVDTGFIVFNERTYPLFTKMLAHLGIDSQPSTMSLSIRCDETGLEYNGTSLNTLFAQRSNLLNPGFLAMLSDLLKFNKLANEAVDYPGTLGSFVKENGFSARMVDQYLIPMTAAIWSAPRSTVLSMPMRFFVSFFRNHGMLTINDRPMWKTVVGGSRAYVNAICENLPRPIRVSCPVKSVTRHSRHVEVLSKTGNESFDHVVIATHSPEAMELLADATSTEREVLSAIPYQSNEAVLHTDVSLMPKRTLAWAAWNAHVDLKKDAEQPEAATGVTYNLSILQRLPTHLQYMVTLNRSDRISSAKVIRKFVYHHPVFNQASVEAQQRHSEISGVARTHFCGAYWGYGFHEDGVRSAVRVCKFFGEEL
ncbi:MAG: FAD-dependent oxidoreductase [Phycisphaerales bacterium]